MYPPGCFVCRSQSQTSSTISNPDIIVGYVFSFPLEKNIDSIASFLESHPLSLQPTATCYFIHDMAVHPDFQRKGLGTKMFSVLSKNLKVGEFEQWRLISVEDSTGFWKICGFRRASREDKPENQWAINLIGYDDVIPMSLDF